MRKPPRLFGPPPLKGRELFDHLTFYFEHKPYLPQFLIMKKGDFTYSIAIYFVCAIFAAYFANPFIERICGQMPALSEPISMKQRNFSIPFEVAPEKTADPTREVELLFSKDRGAKWYSAGRLPANGKLFNFEADSDGEYWFQFRTITLSGQVRQSGQGIPKHRVFVDTGATTFSPSRSSDLPASSELSAVNQGLTTNVAASSHVSSAVNSAPISSPVSPLTANSPHNYFTYSPSTMQSGSSGNMLPAAPPTQSRRTPQIEQNAQSERTMFSATTQQIDTQDFQSNLVSNREDGPITPPKLVRTSPLSKIANERGKIKPNDANNSAQNSLSLDDSASKSFETNPLVTKSPERKSSGAISSENRTFKSEFDADSKDATTNSSRSLFVTPARFAVAQREQKTSDFDHHQSNAVNFNDHSQTGSINGNINDRNDGQNVAASTDMSRFGDIKAISVSDSNSVSDSDSVSDDSNNPTNINSDSITNTSSFINNPEKSSHLETYWSIEDWSETDETTDNESTHPKQDELADQLLLNLGKMLENQTFSNKSENISIPDDAPILVAINEATSSEQLSNLKSIDQIPDVQVAVPVTAAAPMAVRTTPPNSDATKSTPPENFPAKITKLSLNTATKPIQIIVKWNVGDVSWQNGLVDILRSDQPNENWVPIATNQRNSGEYWWYLQASDLKPFYVMIRLRNQAGLISQDSTNSPIQIAPNVLSGQQTPQ
ncbi:MAG: hypothetical protein ACRCUY_00920 [Thermoguttaceae bacterium]